MDQLGGEDNIDVLLNTNVEEVVGDERVEGIRLLDTTTDDAKELKAAAIFVFVGAVPHSAVVQGTVAMNEQGFVYTGADIFLNGSSSWTLDREPVHARDERSGDLRCRGRSPRGGSSGCLGGRTRIRRHQHGSQVLGDRMRWFV